MLRDNSLWGAWIPPCHSTSQGLSQELSAYQRPTKCVCVHLCKWNSNWGDWFRVLSRPRVWAQLLEGLYICLCTIVHMSVFAVASWSAREDSRTWLLELFVKHAVHLCLCVSSGKAHSDWSTGLDKSHLSSCWIQCSLVQQWMYLYCKNKHDCLAWGGWLYLSKFCF